MLDIDIQKVFLANDVCLQLVADIRNHDRESTDRYKSCQVEIRG
jgi:hypothetical protein